MADETFDAVIIGGGNKALFVAMYLIKYANMSVGIFERRHEIGGCLATEEIASDVLDQTDPWHPLLFCVRGVKPAPRVDLETAKPSQAPIRQDRPRPTYSASGDRIPERDAEGIRALESIGSRENRLRIPRTREPL